MKMYEKRIARALIFRWKVSFRCVLLRFIPLVRGGSDAIFL